MSQACLSGDDIAALLEGKKITAYGVDFVYDGIGSAKIEKALVAMKKQEKPEKRKKETQE